MPLLTPGIKAYGRPVLECMPGAPRSDGSTMVGCARFQLRASLDVLVLCHKITGCTEQSGQNYRVLAGNCARFQFLSFPLALKT